MQQFLIGSQSRASGCTNKVVVVLGRNRRPAFINTGSALLKGNRCNTDPTFQQRGGGGRIPRDCLAKSREVTKIFATELDVQEKHSRERKNCDVRPSDAISFESSETERLLTDAERKLHANFACCHFPENLTTRLSFDLSSLNRGHLKKIALLEPWKELETGNLMDKIEKEEETSRLRGRLEESRQQIEAYEADLRQTREEKHKLMASEHNLTLQLEKSQKKEATLIGQMRDLQQKHDEIQMTLAVQSKELNEGAEIKKKLETLKNDLEQQFESEQLDHRLLQARYAAMQMERDNHLQQLRLTLEESAREKKELREKFDKELEFLRNCNVERDHQLMDDYEWKLREIERDHKQKIDNEKKLHRDALASLKETLETDFEKQLRHLENERDGLQVRNDELLAKVDKQQKMAETELKQLRGFTEELQKGMKAATSDADRMRIDESQQRDHLEKVEEKLQAAKRQITKLQSEICDLKESHLQRLKSVREQNRNHLEEIKSDNEVYWKNHFKEETAKLQAVMEEEYENEKQFAMEALQSKKNAEMVMLQTESKQREAELLMNMSLLEQENHELALKVTELHRTRAADEELLSGQKNQCRDMQVAHQEELALLRHRFQTVKEEAEAWKREQEKLLDERLSKKLSLQEEEQQKRLKVFEDEAKQEQARICEKWREDLEKQCCDLEYKKKCAVDELQQSHKQDLKILQEEFDRALTVIKLKDKQIKDLEKEFHYRDIQTQELQYTSEVLEKKCYQMAVQLKHQQSDCLLSRQDSSQNARYWLTQIGFLPIFLLLSFLLTFIFLSLVLTTLLPYVPL